MDRGFKKYKNPLGSKKRRHCIILNLSVVPKNSTRKTSSYDAIAVAVTYAATFIKQKLNDSVLAEKIRIQIEELDIIEIINDAVFRRPKTSAKHLSP